VQPQNFAQPSPDAVALDCAAQRFLDAPAKSAEIEAIRANENGELAARPAPTPAIDGVVFGAAHHAAFARQAERRRIRLS